jgi:hypothetical protein
VQDPAGSEVATMPSTAIALASPDAVGTLGDIATLIATGAANRAAVRT